MPNNQLSPYDRDLLARTALAEGGSDPQSQAAVLSTIRNRLISGQYGDTVQDVVKAPKQFEVWSDGSANRLDPNSDAYQKAARMVDATVAGLPDNTGGATHFYSPTGQQARAADGRRLIPAWAKNQTAAYSSNVYFAPNGRVQQPAQPPSDAIPTSSDATAPQAQPVSVGNQVAKTTNDDPLAAFGVDTSAVPKDMPTNSADADPLKAFGVDTSKHDAVVSAPTDTAPPLTVHGGGTIGAFAGGALKGIPIVGPAIISGANHLAAAAAALDNNTKFSDELNKVNQYSNATFNNNPTATTVGEIGGNLLGYGTLGASAIGAKALGGVGGNLLMRGATAIPVNAAIGAGDAAVRSNADPTQTAIGAGLGAVGGIAGPAIGAAAEKIGAGVRGAIEPFTASGQSGIADRVIDKFAQGGGTAADTTKYVPGSIPTLAQATANPGLATAERAMRDVRPNMFGERDQINQLARNNVVEALKGDENSLSNLIQLRQEATDPIREHAFANAGNADPSSVVAKIDEILASPAGQRDSVVKALGNIRKKFIVEPGQAETTLADGTVQPAKPPVYQDDPAQLYGIRQAIGDMMSPLNGATESSPRLASAELGNVKDALDPVIEDAAPGFGDYLKTFHEMSKPINEQQFLQNANTSDVKGDIKLGAVDRLLKNIQKGRQASGTNNAKSVSPDTLNKLTGVYADLNRASNSSLGKSIGSNSFQNLATANVMNRLGVPSMVFDSLNANPKMALLSYLARKAYGSKNDAILDALASKLLDPTHQIGAGTAATALQGRPYGALGSSAVQNVLTSPAFAGVGTSVNRLLGSPKSDSQ